MHNTHTVQKHKQADAGAATVIQAFAGRPILKASAAYNHSSAITSSGRVYTWGSAATGKVRARAGSVSLSLSLSWTWTWTWSWSWSRHMLLIVVVEVAV